MYSLFRKIHMYLGLLNLSALLVYGIAGVWATLEPGPEARHRPEPAVEYRAYTPPAGLDDKQLADHVHQFLKLPLTAPLPKYALKRDANNDLALDFYTANGVRNVLVLEKENRIRVAQHRVTTAAFLNNLHATTQNYAAPDWRMRAWAYYNEFALWSLIGMALSGLYLWLASRPFYGPARWAFALGSACFIGLYILTR